MKTYSSKPLDSERSSSVSCNFCGSEQNIRYYSIEGADFCRCRSCGLVFQNPMPDEHDLLHRYDAQYYDYEIENEKQFFNLMKFALEDIRFKEISRKLPSEKKFLDIGCATGMLLESLIQSGEWQAEGVEVCEAAVLYGRRERGLSIFHGRLEDAPFPAESFDIVHASHVIEHLTDPYGFLKNIADVLKPGGYIIITTPNISGFQSRVFKSKWRSAIADHMHLFSKKTLTNYFHELGFTILRRKTWGGIAKGLAGDGLKGIIDTIAKQIGWGDVMVFLGQK